MKNDPVQLQTGYADRARYYSTADAFNVARPRIPAHRFIVERDQAMAPDTFTGLIPLDLSGTLDLSFPATTPLILARYVRIRAGEFLQTQFNASEELYYVIAGRGASSWGVEELEWGVGDLFCLPGGTKVMHRAANDSVLWVVTNEPELAFHNARAAGLEDTPIQAVLFPASELRRQVEANHRLPAEITMAGKGVILVSKSLDKYRTCLPTLSVGLNSLAPGASQKPHRHNAVAVTLILQAEGCYSMIDGKRIDWLSNAVMITPPGEMHSHHNQGDQAGWFLVVQDGGLHYHCRTMGFSYT
ncbi:MAG: cupin domain-containing protein [Acidobacteria bacterium]|nr:cupin domain-containing protein [Acidobacteriota bacterium]